ncbi:MAG: cytochrome c [Pseudomonadota bacterium]
MTNLRGWTTSGLSAAALIAAAAVTVEPMVTNSAAHAGPPPIVYKEFPNQCARCHKPDGRGGPAYGGFAADLRETGLDKEGLIYIITEGIRLNGMPEFKTTMSKREIDGIAQYIVDNIIGKYYDKEGNRISAEEAAAQDVRLKDGTANE